MNDKVKEAYNILKDIKMLGLVFEIYREDTPKAVTQGIYETFTGINQALTALDEPDKLLKTCPKCKRIEALSWDARAKVYTCLYCLYTERPNVCQTCGGSGEVDDTIHSVNAGIDISKPCPACQLKPSEGEFICEKCGEKLPMYLKAIHLGNKYMFGDCKGKLKPKPEQQSGEFVKELNEAVDNVVISYATNCLEIVEEYAQKLVNISRKAADRIKQLEAEAKEASSDIKKLLAYGKEDKAIIEQLESEKKSWRRVCEKIEGEKKQLTARTKELEAMREAKK